MPLRAMQAELVMTTHHKQRGLALLVLVFFLALTATAYLVRSLDSNAIKVTRDKKSAIALAEAKDALIGFAAGINLGASRRPGDLPCPDTNDDGQAEASCNTATSRLGRLPWRTLGLPDLRDATGERLWYAVSNNFKNSTRTNCPSPGSAGCLNSDTAGTITLRNTNGTILNNGATGTGVVAVIFSVGPPITRSDGVVQDRTCGGCSLNAVNYLDISAGEDNANFVDSTTDGFILGPVANASGDLAVNDSLMVIAIQDIMPKLEQRVANETLACLKNYAATKSGGLNRHPWAVQTSAYATFDDTSNIRLGRIPDTTFDETRSDSGNIMQDTWGASCNINPTFGWWLNWKDLVFYAVAWDKDPSNTASPPCDNNVPNDCLTVKTPDGNQIYQKVAVLVAGKALPGQARATTANKRTLSNYLEGENIGIASGTNPNGEDAIFEQKASTTTFNDVVVSY